MAAVLSTTLTSTAGEGYILKADLVACEVETVTGGLVTERVKTTLAKKLDDLNTLINGKASSSEITSAIAGLQQAITDTNKLDATLIKYTPAGGTETTVASYLSTLLNTITSSDVSYTKSGETTPTTVKIVLDELYSNMGAVSDIGTPAVSATYYTDVDSYNSAKGTSLSAAEFNALPQSEKIKTAAVAATGLYKLRDDAATSATTATNQATLAQNAANSAATSLTSIATEKSKAISAIQEQLDTIQTNLTESLDKIDSVETLTNKLINAFEVSDAGSEGKANFVILSKTAYEAETNDDNINDNVVYFVYDNDEEEENYCTITVLRSNDTYGYVTGGGSYKKNEENGVTLLASPKTGYSFSGWTLAPNNDTIIYTDTLYQFTPTEDATYYAQFVKPGTYYTVLISAGTGGTATISNSTTDNKYEAETIHTLTAIPNEHYTFKNWTYTVGGTVSSDTDATKSITINKDITYIANFTEDPKYTITVDCESTLGTVTGGETVYKDTTITIVATPASGYTFKNWTLNGEEVSVSASYTFNVTEDQTYVANFTTTSTEATGEDASIQS